MGLLKNHLADKYFRVKHSFNADDDAETLLRAADKVLGDKTQFINRCIAASGPGVLQKINDERNHAVSEVLREFPPPVKRNAG